MKINANTIKPGMVLQHNGGLWVVTKASHVKPGKGGAFANVEAKNIETGNKLNERFRSEDKVERVTLEQKEFSYLYEQGDALVGGRIGRVVRGGGRGRGHRLTGARHGRIESRKGRA